MVCCECLLKVTFKQILLDCLFNYLYEYSGLCYISVKNHDYYCSYYCLSQMCCFPAPNVGNPKTSGHLEGSSDAVTADCSGFACLPRC